MKFKLNVDYYELLPDEHCWVLTRKTTPKPGKEDKDNYTVVGYYSTIEHVAKKLLNLGLIDFLEHQEIENILKESIIEVTNAIKHALSCEKQEI